MGHGAERFLQRVLSPRIEPAWWNDLRGEVRQSREEKGRFIKDTLDAELLHDYPSYRNSPRHLYFFSRDVHTSIDGRVEALGVEEKYSDLSFPSIIDGAIHRTIVWVIGNPHSLPADAAEAVALCVVCKCASPMIAELSDALVRVCASLAAMGIHIVYIQENSGQHWMAHVVGGQEPLPAWLAATGDPGHWELPPVNPEAVTLLNGAPPGSARARHLFDRQQTYGEYDAGPGTKLAILDWSNHWQMIDVGLLLRGAGYAAVKVRYRGRERLTAAGRGVERAVRGTLLEKFGVMLDWGVAV